MLDRILEEMLEPPKLWALRDYSGSVIAVIGPTTFEDALVTGGILVPRASWKMLEGVK